MAGRLIPDLGATRLQLAAYLVGVCAFSITFLVFLNASISFVVTDIVGQKKHVGDVVGTLGIVDELLALVACPLWGLLSDRLGVRLVLLLGFVFISLAFVCFPHASHAYPDLILIRLIFATGSAACTTMITAILPSLTVDRSASATAAVTRSAPSFQPEPVAAIEQHGNRNSMALSVSSELTITPARYGSFDSEHSPLLETTSNIDSHTTHDKHAASSTLAGYVGMFTGFGALLAVTILLPLPAILGSNQSKAEALSRSYDLVAVIALAVAAAVWLGLKGLAGEEDKALGVVSADDSDHVKQVSSNYSISKTTSLVSHAWSALTAIATDSELTLACVGGLVARASTIGTSLFIPLFVNAYFLRQGLCDDDPSEPLKQQCKRAYALASMLSGISQLVALLSAPLFGYLGARLGRWRYVTQLPLAIAAVAGITGSICFGLLDNPDPFAQEDQAAPSIMVIAAVALMGISQIGAIVCSLGLLARGVQGRSAIADRESDKGSSDSDQSAHGRHDDWRESADRTHLKGTIAGIYSFFGSMGIMILSKVGGLVFDKRSPGGPFFILAGFNGLLLIAIGLVLVQHRLQL